MKLYCLLPVILSSIALPSMAQPNHKPAAIKKVKPEKKSDSRIEQKIIEVFDLKRNFRDVPTHYDFNRVDLNGDGEPEILVHLFGKNMCDTQGCTTLILTKQGNGYKVLAQIGSTKTPVFVSEHATNGWTDLIVMVSGRSTLPTYYAVLPFNGHGYPENATVAPAEPLDTSQPAIAYLVGGGKSGFKIAPSPK